MKPCAVKWCCAMVVEGDVCAVHAKYPDLHPETLACDEEAVGVGVKCDACDGTGDCGACEGSGETDCHCHCGDEHETDCGACDGSGKCPDCKGTGSPQVKKRQAA